MAPKSSNSANNAGFSLAEVMVALVIFGFVSLSVAQGVIQLKTTSRALTIEQLVDETINGYIAQLNAMDYDVIENASASGAGTEIPVENNFTLMTSADPLLTDETINLSLDTWTDHTILGHFVNQDGDLEAAEVVVAVKLEVQTDADLRISNARIDYRWQPPLRRPERTAHREFIIGDPSDNLNN